MVSGKQALTKQHRLYEVLVTKIDPRFVPFALTKGDFFYQVSALGICRLRIALRDPVRNCTELAIKANITIVPNRKTGGPLFWWSSWTENWAHNVPRCLTRFAYTKQNTQLTVIATYLSVQFRFETKKWSVLSMIFRAVTSSPLRLVTINLYCGFIATQAVSRTVFRFWMIFDGFTNVKTRCLYALAHGGSRNFSSTSFAR